MGTVMVTRTVILLPLAFLVLGEASGQKLDQASHKVTVKRAIETRVSGPIRVPVRPQGGLTETSRLQVTSSVPLLKLVFSLVEPSDPLANLALENTGDPTLEMKQLYSVQELIRPAVMNQVDLASIARSLPAEFPDDGVPTQRLVVTITE